MDADRRARAPGRAPGLLLPAALEQIRTASGDPEPLERLRVANELANQLRHRADEVVDIQVRLSRTAGRTWSDIGKVLGTTRQAAQQHHGTPEAMTRRLAADAREALSYAAPQARRMGHAYLGTEHVLLGVLRRPPAALSEAMLELGITMGALRSEILEIVGTSSAPRPRRLGMAPRLRRVMEIAGELAADADRYEITNCELLLGMISEAGGVGVRALAGLGFDVAALADSLSATRHQSNGMRSDPR